VQTQINCLPVSTDFICGH